MEGKAREEDKEQQKRDENRKGVLEKSEKEKKGTKGKLNENLISFVSQSK